MIKIAKTAIRNVLVNDSNIMSKIGNNQARVVYGTAHPDTTLPYIVFKHAFGSDDNTVSDSMDMLIDVKCIATDGETADDVAALIHTALHNTKPSMTNPWGCINLESVSIIDFIEEAERTQFYHVGHTFRLRAHKV